MKKLAMVMAVAGLILTVNGTAGAATTYGGKVTPEWNLGTNQPTGNFVVDDNGNVQTALRATGRYTGALAPVNDEGRYFALPGTSPDPPAGAATWNFCFHVNVATELTTIVAGPATGLIGYYDGSPSLTLDDVTLILTVDDDPAVGQSAEVLLDLKQVAEAAAGGAIDWTLFVGMRGSENLGFSWLAQVAAAQGKTWNFDPEVVGEYEFSMTVYDQETTPNLLGQTDMKVTVPEPATMGLLGLGLAFLRLRRRRRNK